jgi:integrase
MHLAWFLLMLHAGLRTGEVRRLTPADIDWERRRAGLLGRAQPPQLPPGGSEKEAVMP